jgi:signal transduction histidine kinase
VGSYSHGTLLDDELKFLSTLAQYLAIAMERVRREAQLVTAQTKLQEHAESLEAKVHERTALLHEMIAQLESFSYTVAHDLRAPIRALQGYSEILRDDFGHLLPEEGMHTVSRLTKASQRLDALTRDLLRFSKIARSDVELEPVNIAEIIEELKSYTPLLQTALSVDMPLGVARAQRTLLQQCLANLIENAVKFAKPKQAPRIHIRSEHTSEPTPIGSAPSHAFHPPTFGTPGGVTTKPSQPWLRIWVEDNGIGIPERARTKIFGIFERSAGSEHVEGTGIGLAIVARAMHQMGGACGVESKVGEGSRFWLELPAAI